MSILTFLNALHDSGAVRLPPLEFSSSGDQLGAVEDFDEIGPILRRIDGATRGEIAFPAPPLHIQSAAWAAEILYRACQFLVYRHIPGPIVQDTLQRPCPVPPAPEVCYSVDLLFEHLPQLWALAKGLAEGDPLTHSLHELARAWPLSSVGIPGLAALDISPILGHPALRRLYADRIIERGDVARLEDPRVIEAVSEAIGAHPELSPRIAEQLKERVANG